MLTSPSTETAAGRAADDRASRRERAGAVLRTFGTAIVAVALLVVFALSSPDFLTPTNLDNILIQISVVGVVSIGETAVMLLGGIDLSVGSVLLLSAVVIGALTTNAGVPVALAIPVGLLLATGMGLINGFFAAVVGIEPIIVTLGTLLAVQGLAQVLLQANNSWIMVSDPLFFAMAAGRVAFLPVMGVIMVLLYAAAALVLARTLFGRYIYALGGNPAAARLTGLPVTRVLVAAYAFAGLCAGIGGLLAIAQLGIVSPNVGAGMEFNAVTAVLVGGLSLSGGVGRVEKTLLGALIVGMIANYLTLKGVSAYYEQAVSGLVILAAVILDHLARRGRTR